jgi:aromatic ring-cleaving dioxygenase
MKGFTIECTTPGGDVFLAALGRQLCARAGPEHVTSSTTSSLLAVTSTTASSTRLGREGHYTLAATLPTLFGWALGWIMCNRPAALGVTLTPRDDDDCDDGDNHRQALISAVHFPPATVQVSFANRPTMDTDPTSSIEVFHLHCHFQGSQGSQGSQGQTKSQTKSQTPGVVASSEAAALRVLEDTKAAIRAGGSTPLHDHVWHEKNGPHDPWSWELWVEDTEALGHAALHFLRVATAAGEDGAAGRSHSAGRHGAGSGADEGLYFAIHCDTGQEYTDHAARMCWVGRTDPLPLDLHFFTPEEGYEGPDATGLGRRSNGETLYSMGEGGLKLIYTSIVLGS